MRKILFVTEFDEKTAEFNSFLSNNFATQLCSDTPRSVRSMLKVFAPDLILLNVDSLGNTEVGIYEAIKEYSETIPVITYGSEVIKQKFSIFYRGFQFKHIPKVDNYITEPVFRAICDAFSMDADMILNSGVGEPAKSHVLVVDDNPVLLRNMRGMLQEKYKVSLATSAAQCMKQLSQEMPDIIIMDYEMPVVDGCQTLAMIRAEEEFADLPVIFLTGIADKAHVDKVLELKPAAYFVKPPMQTKIISAIESILERYK